MKLRGRIKRALFGSVPLFRGRFKYFGQTVHFPIGSHIFDRVCDEGIYESETVRLILSLIQPGTAYIDVGANIGLLSVPVVANRADVNVVSIEPSPATVRYLEKTRASSIRSKHWTIVNAAVGSEVGNTIFWSAGEANGAFDGIRDTGRGGPKTAIEVPVLTLDEVWHRVGRPTVSVIKMDIEGGEYLALRGAKNVIRHSSPVFIIEWSSLNLPAYGVEPRELLEICRTLDYIAYALPKMVLIENEAVLRLMMAETETFVLMPRMPKVILADESIDTART